MDETKWYLAVNYLEAKNIIRDNLENMSRTFIATGYYLRLVKDTEGYKEDGYKDIWEFAEDQYGIKRSTASRWMDMNEKFSKGGNSPILSDEYKEYGKSQLQELLYLPEDKLDEVTPDMTVKEIREVRKPGEPKLQKPDERQKEYLNLFAKHFIDVKQKWFLADYQNRVMNVLKSPDEIKERLGADNRTWYFLVDGKSAHINLFDDYVQVWDEEGQCLGNFEWFYLVAAIQSMWNVVVMEEAQKKREQEDAESSESRECECAVDDMCDVAQEPEELSGEEVELSESDSVDEDADTEYEEEDQEVYEETDMDIARKELDKANDFLKQMSECYEENDRVVRKQKIIVAALASYVCDLDDILNPPIEPEQPELQKLRNNEQRKEFLDTFHDWPVWFEISEASEVYYRYDLSDGSSIVICEYKTYCEWKTRYKEDPETVSQTEYLLKPGYHYLNDCRANHTALVEHLKQVQKGA